MPSATMKRWPRGRPRVAVLGPDDGVAVLIVRSAQAGIGRGGVDHDVIPVHEPVSLLGSSNRLGASPRRAPVRRPSDRTLGRSPTLSSRAGAKVKGFYPCDLGRILARMAPGVPLAVRRPGLLLWAESKRGSGPRPRVFFRNDSRDAWTPSPKLGDFAYRKTTLPNGLDVILRRQAHLPIVAVNLWYHVGSKDEERSRRGFAHLFRAPDVRGLRALSRRLLQAPPARRRQRQRLDLHRPHQLFRRPPRRPPRTGPGDGIRPDGPSPAGPDGGEAADSEGRRQERIPPETTPTARTGRSGGSSPRPSIRPAIPIPGSRSA